MNSAISRSPGHCSYLARSTGRQITQSLFSYALTKEHLDLQFREASLARGHTHAHGEECPERQEQIMERCLVSPTSPPTEGDRCLVSPTSPPTEGDRCLVSPTSQPTEGDRCLVSPTSPPTEGDRCLVSPTSPPTEGDRCLVSPTSPPTEGDRTFPSYVIRYISLLLVKSIDDI